MDENNVTSRVTLLGGAFGRKSKPDFAAEAAILSRQLGVPVKVTWSREDDIQHAYYHTPTALHVKAGLDKNGKVVAYHSNSVFPTIWSTFEKEDPQLGHPIELSLGYLDVPYHVPNLRLENGKAKAHVRIGWLRSVNNIPNAFAQNSMANMLAYAAGRDPYEFLLELIGPDRVLDLSKTAYWNYDQTYDEYPIMTARLKGVLRTAAEHSGYGKKKLGAREAIGLAVHRSFTTYVATAVHVKVGNDGSVEIPSIDVAADAGRLINPERVIAQMEGASVYGLSTCTAQITAKDGRIVQHNFDDYTVARMPVSPREIRVHLVNSGGQYPPGGVGEPGTPPFAPALTNAIFAATGKRITELPIDNDLLKA
jgi:isoquinoline 1-oxidoreductase beta subunit